MRPPKMKAAMGTPFGSSQCSSSEGQRASGVVNREFGCAAGRPEAGVQLSPSQSVSWGGGSRVKPSHQTSPSGVSATLVKIVSSAMAWMALGLLTALVHGATPKKPFSGFMAYSLPSLPGLIQAMSSPTVVIFQPLKAAGGNIIAKLVLPQALGKAAAT